MKPEIHPKYYKTKAICACGASYDIGSTKEKIHVDICSNCHPLFTGKQKLLDTEGRVQKFKKKYAGITVKAKKPVKKKKIVKKATGLTSSKSPGKK
jgi:large subunit ribosomal protein L31